MIVNNESAQPEDARQRLDEMLSKLKEHGFRITPQRLAILKVLAVSEGHPSAEKIYEQVRSDFPTTSIATVYKTIHVLKEINQVLELGFPGGSNRYDGNNPCPHPHVICVKCQKIFDPDLESLQDMTAEVSAATGFEIMTHRLDFFGLCPECQRKE
jgi:Fur family peroxide stress response transcriptional regulator